LKSVPEGEGGETRKEAEEGLEREAGNADAIDGKESAAKPQRKWAPDAESQYRWLRPLWLGEQHDILNLGMSQTGSKADPALQLPDANADKQSHPPEHENSEAAGTQPVSDRNAA
jgi:hypothetical protein